MTRSLLPSAAVVVLLAGCGGGSASSNATAGSSAPAHPATASAPQVGTRKLPGLGAVLVNGQGRTLYMFAPDKHAKVTCTGTCARVWPPVKLPSGASAHATGAARSTLLGSDPDAEGGRVVTYAGWPLYTYLSDTAPGSAVGQATNLNGGLWYVLSPSGKVITRKP
ncbi:MAG TPA: hypothetical protein VH279_05770 [Solirubrobacteraceae bacterium]|nr:hypothetical protein [Solirubrobacteraceae bacterium]